MYNKKGEAMKTRTETNEGIIVVNKGGKDVKIWDEKVYLVYQKVCDEVFGKGKVTIAPAEPNYAITPFAFVEEYGYLRTRLVERLKRLKVRFEGSHHYSALLKQVELLADPKMGDKAYATLAAWDLAWDELEDEYYDTGVLSDSVGGLLHTVVDEAIKNSGQTMECHVKTNYAWDDEVEKYWAVKYQLTVELTKFLRDNNTETKKARVLESEVMPGLEYVAYWGYNGEIDESCYGYNPYYMAERTKDYIFKRYADKIMNGGMEYAVLVRVPWTFAQRYYFKECDCMFFRELARRTFFGYKHSDVLMKDVDENYEGEETVYEVSRHLAGIVVIDEGWNKEKIVCHTFANPNWLDEEEKGACMLIDISEAGDEYGFCEDFEYDNY